jgi:hypothetical protein
MANNPYWSTLCIGCKFAYFYKSVLANNVTYIYRRYLIIKLILLFEIPSFAAQWADIVVNLNKICNLVDEIKTTDEKQIVINVC